MHAANAQSLGPESATRHQPSATALPSVAFQPISLPTMTLQRRCALSFHPFDLSATYLPTQQGLIGQFAVTSVVRHVNKPTVNWETIIIFAPTSDVEVLT